MKVVPQSAQSSSCTSSWRDDEGRTASLIRLAIMSHCGANTLDLAPKKKKKEDHERCHGRKLK